MPKGDDILRTSLHKAINAGAYRVAINRKAMQAGQDLLVATKQLEKAVPLADMLHDKLP